MIFSILFIVLFSHVNSSPFAMNFFTPPSNCNETGSCCDPNYMTFVWEYAEEADLTSDFDCSLIEMFYGKDHCFVEEQFGEISAFSYTCGSVKRENLTHAMEPYVIMDVFNSSEKCLDREKRSESFTTRYYVKYSSCDEVYCFLYSLYKMVFTTTFDGKVMLQARGCKSDELSFEAEKDKCTQTDDNLVVYAYVPDEFKDDIVSLSAYETCKASRYGSASPSGGGRLCGDPHITTFDGNRYSFQGLGEYYLVRTKDFDLTGTFVAMDGSSSVSVTQKFNLFYKDHEFEIAFDNKTKGYTFIFDGGEPLDIDTIQTVMKCGSCVSLAMLTGETSKTNGEYFEDLTISFSEFELYKATVEFSLEDGTKIIANHRRGWWCMSVLLSEKHFDNTKGLMGVWNRKKAHDFVDADGTLYANPSDEEIWNFGVSWEVGTTSARRKMMEDEYEPNIIQDIEGYLTQQGINIDDVCKGVEDESSKLNCAYDVVIGGINESDVSEQYIVLEEQIFESVGSNTAPFIAGNQGDYELFFGEKFEVSLKVYDNEDDEIIASIYNNTCIDFVVNIIPLEGEEDGAQANLTIYGTFYEECNIIVNVSDIEGMFRMAKIDLAFQTYAGVAYYIFIIIGAGVVACVIFILLLLACCCCCCLRMKNGKRIIPIEMK